MNRSKAPNQYDIRTSNDLVSGFNPFKNKNNGKETTIQSKTNNIVKEHSIDNLDNLQADSVGGKIKNIRQRDSKGRFIKESK